MIEKTLVLIKPDAVQRGLVGEITTRFEKAGLKIIGMKQVWANEDFAKQHYTEDITKRRGEFVRNKLISSLHSGPVVALCLEGVKAISLVRKMVGDTESSKAAPGTIRGDYSHMTFDYCDTKGIALPNVVHASGNEEDAKQEIKVWFKNGELHSYRIPHEHLVQ